MQTVIRDQRLSSTGSAGPVNRWRPQHDAGMGQMNANLDSCPEVLNRQNVFALTHFAE
jgi:hypothetical protein